MKPVIHDHAKKPQLLNTGWCTNKDGPAIYSNTWDASGCFCGFFQLTNV